MSSIKNLLSFAAMAGIDISRCELHAVERSIFQAPLTQAQRFIVESDTMLEARACWVNAASLVLSGEGKFDLCVGYANSVIPVAHGWIRHRETDVHYDPTWELFTINGVGKGYLMVESYSADEVSRYHHDHGSVMDLDSLIMNGHLSMMTSPLDVQRRFELANTINREAPESLCAAREYMAGMSPAMGRESARESV